MASPSITLSLHSRHREQRSGQVGDAHLGYQNVVESMFEGIVVVHRDEGIKAWNQAAMRILGLSEDQLKGVLPFDPGWRLIHPDGSDLPYDALPHNLVFQTGKARFRISLGIVKPDGSTTWIWKNVVPMPKGGEEHPTTCIISFIDITQQARQSAELRDAETRYSKLFNEIAMPAMVARMPGFVVVEVNAACEALFCRARNDMLGIPIRELDLGIDADDLSSFEEGLRHCDILRNVEQTVKTRSGTTATVLTTVSSMRIGGVPHVMIAMLDITRRRCVERALERTTQRLTMLRSIDLALLDGEASTETITHYALGHLRALLGCRRAAAGLFDIAEDLAHVAVSDARREGVDVEIVPVPPSLRGLIAEELHEGMQLVEDVATLDPRHPLTQRLMHIGVQSAIVAPLKSPSILYGLLIASWDFPRSFSIEEVEIVNEVVDQLTLAISGGR